MIGAFDGDIGSFADTRSPSKAKLKCVDKTPHDSILSCNGCGRRDELAYVMLKPLMGAWHPIGNLLANEVITS